MSITTSLLTAGVNSHQETSENFNALATDFVTAGVTGSIALSNGVTTGTGSFAVNAQGSPNMTVAVSAGTAWLFATPSGQNSQGVRVKNSASSNVTISANASGSTKYDFVYISVDATKAANPAVNADDVATLVTSRSSSSTTDNGTPPTYGYCIAVVTVANGASSITQANISDKRGNAVLSSAGVSQSSSWNNLGLAPNTVAANGNRSYTLTFTGADVTGTLSPGARLRTTRTVAAPTQCTSLNGSTQFYSKTSPAGMTFTNNFVVGGWVKLTSYTGNKGIISRWTGTNGWRIIINSSGQVQLTGLNAGGANFSEIISYQSIPLNKWVHIAGQLDMSSFSNSPTTSYIMIDGVDVPCTVARGGTNPVSLVQGGNLEVGSENAADFFPGKIAQAFVYSAKVTQATILASMHQTPAGTETSLISAYSFNNTINDLNVSNANNLTPNGSAVATNADSPFGGQAGGTISSTLDYGIVQSATFSTNTTLVVQVPEGCTIPTSGGVTSVVYSANKAPYGMPVQRGKWSLESRVIAQATQNTPGTSTIYNLGNFQINLPVGEWSLRLDANYQISTGGTTNPGSLLVGISTANNTFSDPVAVRALQGRNDFPDWPVSIPGYASLSASAPYYINAKNLQGTCTFIAISTDNSASQLIAENSYL